MLFPYKGYLRFLCSPHKGCVEVLYWQKDFLLTASSAGHVCHAACSVSSLALVNLYAWGGNRRNGLCAMGWLKYHRVMNGLFFFLFNFLCHLFPIYFARSISNLVIVGEHFFFFKACLFVPSCFSYPGLAVVQRSHLCVLIWCLFQESFLFGTVPLIWLIQKNIVHNGEEMWKLFVTLQIVTELYFW